DPRRDRAREAALRLPPGRGAVQVRVRARRRGRLRGEDRVSGGGALRVAMLSVHTCPLAALGGKETGGMNVYVRELSRELGRLGGLKNRAARSVTELEPALRLREETRIVGASDRIVAANVVERAELLRDYAAHAPRIATIPCGVDTALFAPGDPTAARVALALQPHPVLLWVGRIAPIKGLDTLLDAIARLRAAGTAL